ncbi:MAG: trypsin-like peptidase domain-containing protein, partial [Candidatus Zixiibacteriota bacterium]
VVLILTLPSGTVIKAGESSGASSLGNLSEGLQQLTTMVSPSVVQILVSGYAPPGSVPGSSSLLPTSRSSGSGVILHPDGYIITNAHVVDGANRIQVTMVEVEMESGRFRSILKPQSNLLGAQLVGIDRETDLAVLKVQGSKFPYLKLADSDQLQKGQLVLAFGSPLGLENSVTMGVVSAVARQLRDDDPMIYIQTDAAVNPGNSGGPLVNTDGEVVGINTMILSRSGGDEGISLAAPSNIVATVFEQLRTTGTVRRGIIGVNAQSLTPALSIALGLNRTFGVIAGDVYPGSPARDADLRVGDLILTLNGKPMENGRQFDVNIYRHSIGERVTLEIVRHGDTLTKRVAIVEREEDQRRFASMVSPGENLVPELGILGLNLSDEIREMLPSLRQNSGVAVAARAASVASWNSGFVPGDVIHSINNEPVADLAALRRQLSEKRAGTPVAIHLERQGKQMYVSVEIQ